MIDVLADVLLRRMGAAKSVIPRQDDPCGVHPTLGAQAGAAGADVRIARPRPLAHPAGRLPPSDDPDEALLTLLSELAWRRIRAARTEEDNDEYDEYREDSAHAL